MFLYIFGSLNTHYIIIASYKSRDINGESGRKSFAGLWPMSTWSIRTLGRTCRMFEAQ